MQKEHSLVLEAQNRFVDPRFSDLGTFRDQAIVKVSVQDVDEPPKFHPLSGVIEVSEDAHIGLVVVVITASDPDKANNSVR